MIETKPEAEIVTANLLPIVVGAHLWAERFDRPIASRVFEAASRRLANRGARLEPIVCCDIWYMNQDDLLRRPTLSIGGPGANAATAFIANRVPSALVMEGAYRIVHDVELRDLHAAAWGRDAEATSAAATIFIERYLDRFLERSIDR